MTELEIVRNLAVAGLSGLAVGVEREWSGHASGPAARFAGVRTFFLLGLLGGLAGWLSTELGIAVAAVTVGGAAGLVIAAYVMAARHSPTAIDGTTEAAALVVLVLGVLSGLNFFGYLVRKAAGDSRGYPIAGALGGVLSSTAVTLSFARQSRREPDRAGALALGAVAACVVLLPRVLVVTLALNPRFAPAAALWLVPLLAVGVGIAAPWWRVQAGKSDPAALPSLENPLQLPAAIRMALAFQVVLLALGLVADRFGSPGVVAGAVVVGLTDVDALTFGMSRVAAEPGLTPTAARALLAGVLSNTLLKAGLAVVFGTPGFRRRAVPALLAMAAAGLAGWWLGGLARP